MSQVRFRRGGGGGAWKGLTWEGWGGEGEDWDRWGEGGEERCAPGRSGEGGWGPGGGGDRDPGGEWKEGVDLVWVGREVWTGEA